jgi:protein TonB
MSAGQALAQRITGWVEIEASIRPDGEVLNPVVVASEPPGVFDREALRAYSQWRYCPPSDEFQYPERNRIRLSFGL